MKAQKKVWEKLQLRSGAQPQLYFGGAFGRKEIQELVRAKRIYNLNEVNINLFISYWCNMDLVKDEETMIFQLIIQPVMQLYCKTMTNFLKHITQVMMQIYDTYLPTNIFLLEINKTTFY